VLLTVPDALRLLRAYSQLDGDTTRHVIVDLVENIAADRKAATSVATASPGHDRAE